ncbi:hypothetical protein [Lyngbya sp. PCC 8106]|uniref:hypothetical protein n=1 Tax=Lyngbya sp. (strain PCC 8106) TaxID=313612 RepID=UPI0012E9DFCC|nr:hypothetical protein [Lyngbya sp. PCC 8106]
MGIHAFRSGWVGCWFLGLMLLEADGFFFESWEFMLLEADGFFFESWEFMLLEADGLGVGFWG